MELVGKKSIRYTISKILSTWFGNLQIAPFNTTYCSHDKDINFFGIRYQKNPTTSHLGIPDKKHFLMVSMIEKRIYIPYCYIVEMLGYP